MTAPDYPTDPSAYTVVITRDPADGPVTAIAVHAMRGGQAINTYDDDEALDAFLRRAWRMESTNPHDGQIPSSRAIILAALDDCGITPTEQEG